METTDNKQLPENELRQQPIEEKDHDLSEKKDISEKENPQPKPVKKKRTAKDHAIRFFCKDWYYSSCVDPDSDVCAWCLCKSHKLVISDDKGRGSLPYVQAGEDTKR